MGPLGHPTCLLVFRCMPRLLPSHRSKRLWTRPCLCNPSQPASKTVHHYANVSAQPQVVAAAQQEVLAALAAGRTLSPAQAAALDSPTVTAQEVRQAL